MAKRINPFNEGEVKYKYLVEFNSVGKTPAAVVAAVKDICSCTVKKAETFVDQLGDLLSDNEVCSVEPLETAQSIYKLLSSAGAKVTVYEQLFTVHLDDEGQAKLQVIKIINESLNIGLKASKDLVDRVDMLGVDLKKYDSLDDALALKSKLERAGAKASIKSSKSQKLVFDDESDETVDEDESGVDLKQVFGGNKYHCVLEGKSFGPVTAQQFSNMARFGIVDRNTLVWREGMSNWALASTVAELQAVV